MQLKPIAVDKNGKEVDNVKISPDLITVTIEQAKDTVTMQVPVLPQFDVPNNVFLKGYTITPRVVTIQGTSSVVDAISFINTAKISVASGSSSVNVALVLPTGIKVLEPSSGWVKVSYSAETMTATELLVDGHLYSFLCPSSLQITASDIVVTPSGELTDYPTSCVFLGKGGNF